MRATIAIMRAGTVTERASAVRAQGRQVRIMGCAGLKRHTIDAKRCIRAWQKECLDHFVACGTKHLDHLVHEFVEHYHTERPHQGLSNRAPLGTGPPDGQPSGAIRCSSRLGGRLKHYYREAA